MANYKVEDTKVLETETKQIIRKFASKKDAITLCNLLNSGAGFNGHTPAFILIRIPKVKV